MRYILGTILLVIAIYSYWSLGGANLDYLQREAITKATEICGQDNKVIKQGYQRSVLVGGFGGRIWFQCKMDGVWYQFSISQRINSTQLQVYNFEPVMKFPANIKIN